MRKLHQKIVYTQYMFCLDINLETDSTSKTNYPSVSTSDESVSDEFFSIIRIRTKLILETDYSSRRITRL